jgi:hypothetical protein
MKMRLLPHAVKRAKQRGATKGETMKTLEYGVMRPARLGRISFKHFFRQECEWMGTRYLGKRIEVIAEKERDTWLVVTVKVFYTKEE